jgi:nicotinate-nucleotide adenylyltransferase
VAPLRLGLFGGTFDPPHLGHLVVAQDAVEQLALDRLLFVVAGLPPHKLRERLSPARLRLEMVQAAVEANPLFEASAVEMDRTGPTYTVDTLRHVGATHPEADLFFLMGADQLGEFHEWKEPEAIASLATVVVMAREGSGGDSPPALDPSAGPLVEFVRIPVTRVDLSSTDIRHRVRDGRSVQYLVPREVLGIIEGQGLYRSIS